LRLLKELLEDEQGQGVLFKAEVKALVKGMEECGEI